MERFVKRYGAAGVECGASRGEEQSETRSDLYPSMERQVSSTEQSVTGASAEQQTWSNPGRGAIRKAVQREVLNAKQFADSAGRKAMKTEQSGFRAERQVSSMEQSMHGASAKRSTRSNPRVERHSAMSVEQSMPSAG